MSLVATLAGRPLISGRVYIPAWGIPWAEAVLAEEVQLTGRVSLIVADLTLSGTVMSGGPGPTGRSSYRIAAGAGGWGKTLPAKSYANDAGVKASTVLADAATACGETIDAATLPTTRLGPAWTRDEAPGSSPLAAMAAANWYVGEDGTTRIGKRAARTVSAATSVIGIDRARGTVSLATEAIAALSPGAIVEGLQAVDVLHEVAAGKIRTTLWGAGLASTSRRLEAYRRIIEALDPDRRFRGVYEYRVVTQDAERVNLQPIRVSIGMPDLQRVTVRPGIPGARADLAPGARVLVAFADASAARPVILGFEDAEGGGFLSSTLEIDADDEIKLGAAAGIVVRHGDLVSISPGNGSGPAAGTITLTGAPSSKSKVKA